MDVTTILLFLPISLIMLVIPGPNVVYIITKGMSQGRQAALKGVAGASSGDVFQVLAACWGLTALLKTSAEAFFIMKTIGAIYLFYLGIRCIIDNKQLPAVEAGAATTGKGLFFTGFLTSALNPKTALFFVSFLPQFVSSASIDGQRQIFCLGMIFSCMGFFVLSGYALASAHLKRWFAANDKVHGYFRKVTGMIFIAFGLRLALADK